MAAMHAMVREGLGISILPCYTADRDYALRRLAATPLVDPKFDIWILAEFCTAQLSPPARCSD